MEQTNLFGEMEEDSIPCRLYDWRGDRSIRYGALREKGSKLMKFDFIIGNPPYQEETESDSTRMPPIYNYFMDQAYGIADKVELITPARFLFNAGQTPKAWNQKMLDDPHLKVLYYEQDASKIFSNTDIKGGVAITYRDANKLDGPIVAFVPYSELRSILAKAGAKDVSDSLTDIADSSNVYHLKNIYADHPDYKKYVGDGGRHSQLKTNVLNINPIFTDAPTESDDYVVYGLVNGKRGKKYCHRRYLKSEHKSLFKYKVLVPKAAGSGKFGDTLPEMIVVQPSAAFTQTYISIGTFDDEIEALNLSKYLKTKFCRSLLYVLKITQDNLPGVWRCIPKQDFTNSSDIDWSKPITEIDQQLYAKYGLSDDEIAFIESNVKEMS
jgi:type II restriction enzyme